jgi:hypothetical protein
MPSRITPNGHTFFPTVHWCVIGVVLLLDMADGEVFLKMKLQGFP